jgi:hypothetical protein
MLILFLSLSLTIRALMKGTLTRADLESPQALFFFGGTSADLAERQDDLLPGFRTSHAELYGALVAAVAAAEQDGRAVWVSKAQFDRRGLLELLAGHLAFNDYPVLPVLDTDCTIEGFVSRLRELHSDLRVVAYI